MAGRRPFSPSPDPETFSDTEGEFEVDSIVGEEITLFGTPRHVHLSPMLLLIDCASDRYEIRWAAWQRKDGSNTTWQDGLESTSHTVHPGMQSWQQRTGEMREFMARDTLSIPLQPIGVPAHAYHTWEKANAYEEKGLKCKEPWFLGRFL